MLSAEDEERRRRELEALEEEEEEEEEEAHSELRRSDRPREAGPTDRKSIVCVCTHNRTLSRERKRTRHKSVCVESALSKLITCMPFGEALD
jgi:hypothetical protein